MPEPLDTASDAPVFDLNIYDPQGEKALVLHKSRAGVLGITGDPSYLEDLVHALNTVRFFRRHHPTGTAEQN